MTPSTLQHTESFRLTKTFRQSTSVAITALRVGTRPEPILTLVTPSQIEEAIAPDYQTMDEVAVSFESNPRMRQELREARTWVAGTVLADEALTLRKLRLSRGLSQAQLAESIGTQQPYIARIEGGNADLRLETCRRLAEALGVDLNTLDLALQASGAR